jgi:putative spermidine/putrescine transport system permease protein
VAEVYTFDDFTMSVTPDLTLANLQALFNPANYDIIVRTLVMALAVTMASAMLALPMAWYMARYTSGKMKAFFYIAVMLPMWASYIVKAYAWTLLLAKDGVAQWFLGHLGLEPILTSSDAPGGWRQHLVDLRAGALSGVRLHLAAVYDPAGAGGAGTPAASLLQASADLGARPRQTFRYVVLPLAIPGIAAGSIFTFSLTLGDLSFRSWWGRRVTLSAIWSIPSRGDRQYADGGRVYPGADRADCPLSGVRETSGSVRCTLNAHRCS